MVQAQQRLFTLFFPASRWYYRVALATLLVCSLAGGTPAQIGGGGGGGNGGGNGDGGGDSALLGGAAGVEVDAAGVLRTRIVRDSDTDLADIG